MAVGLPVGVEKLLVDVVDDGFTLYCCGPTTAPYALVASYEWDHSYVDLLTIRDFARVITARVPTSGLPVNIFDPKVVVWAYEGPPQHAVRALLNLVHPTHPDALTRDAGDTAALGPHAELAGLPPARSAGGRLGVGDARRGQRRSPAARRPAVRIDPPRTHSRGPVSRLPSDELALAVAPTPIPLRGVAPDPWRTAGSSRPQRRAPLPRVTTARAPNDPDRPPSAFSTHWAARRRGRVGRDNR
jgi:hypothetical protein